MKKTYIKPEIEMVSVETENSIMLSVSGEGEFGSEDSKQNTFFVNDDNNSLYKDNNTRNVWED